MHAQALCSHDALDDTLIADPDTDAATHPLKEHSIIRLHEIPA
jgi:hypothetical protein